MMELKDIDDDAYENAKENYLKLTSAEDKQPIDKAFLQSLLDGMGDSSSRVILASTNYPERIPPALMRPGRFDIQLHLGRFKGDQIRELLRLMFVWQAPDAELPARSIRMSHMASLGAEALAQAEASDSDFDNDSDDIATDRNIKVLKREQKRIHWLTKSGWTERMRTEIEWLETIPFPDHVWTPAAIVNQHRVHQTLRETALFLSKERPVDFTTIDVLSSPTVVTDDKDVDMPEIAVKKQRAACKRPRSSSSRRSVTPVVDKEEERASKKGKRSQQQPS